MHVHRLPFLWLANEWRNTQKYSYLAFNLSFANIALHETTT